MPPPRVHSPLQEWLLPDAADHDHIRPPPPVTADGFHVALREGDDVELRFEGGWWPVQARGSVVAATEPAAVDSALAR